jgi:hypothetical protein
VSPLVNLKLLWILIFITNLSHMNIEYLHIFIICLYIFLKLCQRNAFSQAHSASKPPTYMEYWALGRYSWHTDPWCLSCYTLVMCHMYIYIPWQTFWILENYKCEVKSIKMYSTNWHSIQEFIHWNVSTVYIIFSIFQRSYNWKLTLIRISFS